MRTIFTSLFILAAIILQAQVTIEVKVESRPSSHGVQPAFEVLVPQATDKEAMDLWKKTLLPGGLFKKEPKMLKIKDEWAVNNIVINEISPLPVNIFAQVNSFTGSIYFRAFFQAENGFLGTQGSPEESVNAASQYVRKFAVELYRDAVGNELKQEEKKLKNLENDLSRLQRQNKSYNNKISDAQKDEHDLKREAQLNEDLLKNQQNVIETDTSDPKGRSAKDQLEKQVKDTQKDIEKTQKSQTKFSRKVNKNERDQDDKAHEIELQKQKVDEVRTKLNNIK